MAGGAVGLVDASGAVLGDSALGEASPALGCWRAAAVLGCGPRSGAAGVELGVAGALL